MNSPIRTLIHRRLKKVDSSEQPKLHHMLLDSLCSQQKVIETSERQYFDCPRYELYKMFIPEEYRKRLKLLTVTTYCFDNDVIYEANDDYSEENGLRLRGPRIPPDAEDPAGLRFFIDGVGDCDYVGMSLGNPVQDVALCLEFETIEEYDSKIKGKLFFEVYSESVHAHIKLTLPPDVPICGGKISATTYGDEFTERILLCSNKFHFDNGDLCLDRSVLAMPLGSSLHLRFEIFITDDDGIKIPFKGAAKIEVPENAAEISGECSIELVVPYEGRIRKRPRIADASKLEAIPITFKVQFESPSWVAPEVGHLNGEATRSNDGGSQSNMDK